MENDLRAIKAREPRTKDLKQKIYARAMELFVKNGFDNVKVSEICDSAKVSIGTFYYYFPSKESILLSFSDVTDQMVDQEAKTLKGKSAEETLRELFLFKIHAMTNSGPELNNISCVAALKHNCDDAFDSHRSIFAHFMRAIEDGVRSGEFRNDLNMYTVTSMLRYVLAGLVLHWSINSEDVDINDEATRLADLFVSMLKPNDHFRP